MERIYIELDRKDITILTEMARRKGLSRSSLVRVWIKEKLLEKEKKEQGQD